MKKVFTFFCALMVCVLFSGVANAQSPVEFQTSSEPTSAGFAENTHWYIMKLKNMFVTIENVDGENNIKLTENNTLTNTYITSDADQWCIVGDAASGYKFYNKKAGVDKVFGMSNLTSTNQSEYNYTEYGKSRAQMHDKGTTSSSAEGGIGTIFEIRTKDAPLTDYYIRINNARGYNDNDGTKNVNGIDLLATDGNVKPKMYTTSEGTKLVSSLWSFKLGDSGYKLSNVNNPEKYIATLTDATDKKTGKTANDFTEETNAVQFTFSKYNEDWFTLRDQNNNIFNGENLDNRCVNYWNSGEGTPGAKWQITEVTSLDIDLHTAADTKSYASVYLPFSVSRVTGAKAYVAKTPETNKVTFSETADGVKAQNGFLLISETGGATATLNTGESNITSAMGGTLLDRTLNEADKATYRVFGQKTSDKTVGFFKPSATLNTISANRAFFTNATGEALRLNFDGMVSGIETTELNNALNNNAPIYDLSGRRVMNAVKGGLYIQNGRKFIVK